MQQCNARTVKVQGTARMASLRPQPVRAPRRALAPRAAAVEAPTQVSQETVDKCVNANQVPGNRCCEQGQVRSSWTAYGSSPYVLCALQRDHELQPQESCLGQP